jgi:hypothetical protein
VTEVFQSRLWKRPSQLYYPAIPTGKLPPSSPFTVATVDEKFLTTRIAVAPQDYDRAKQAWLCHRSQYTPEQVEQLHQARVSALAGNAYFQPLIATIAKPATLLPN